jgi:hypothetical protein
MAQYTTDSYAKELEELKNEDIAYNKISSAKFIFYLQVVGSTLLFIAMCFILWTKRYEGKPKLDVQSSTLYTPVYK